MYNNNEKRNRGGSLRSQSNQMATNFNDMSRLERRFLRKLEALALSRIKWSNLPDSVNERYLERTLLYSGVGVFYDAFEGGEDEPFIVFSKASGYGTLDRYGNYLRWNALPANGGSILLGEGEGVFCLDSETGTAYGDILRDYVTELAELWHLRMTNRRQQKAAKFISFPEEAQIDAKILQQNLDSGKPWGFSINGVADHIRVDTHSIKEPYEQDKFQEDYLNTYDMVLQEMGIKTQPVEKSQYQHVEEVVIANDAVSRAREDLLKPRREAARLINEKFGLNVAVDWNNDQYELLENGPSAEVKTDNIEEGE